MNSTAAAFRFEPFSPKQQKAAFWWDPASPVADRDMLIAHGSIRSGKTIAMLDSFVNWSLTHHRHKNFIVAGKSMGALKRNVIEPLFQLLRAKRIRHRYHRSENPHIVIGTNVYYLFGGVNEASQDVLQGLTAAGAFLDEAALFPRSFVEQAIGRCSAETDGHGAKIFMNCNPAGPYHYLKQEYIDQADEKNIYVLHFTMDDNNALSDAVKERYARMFTGVFYQRFIEGAWTIAEGLIFDMFDEDKHVVPTKGRPYRKYYVSIDYGTRNPTTFGLWGLYRGTWYKIKEYYFDSDKEGRQKTDQDYMRDLQAFTRGVRVKGYVVDPSAASFIALMKRHRLPVIPANNDVVDGIRNMQNALREGTILYNDGCEETFREFHSYAWDDKAAARGVDKPIKESDHALDSDRYFIQTVLYQPQAHVSAASGW